MQYYSYDPLVAQLHCFVAWCKGQCTTWRLFLSFSLAHWGDCSRHCWFALLSVHYRLQVYGDVCYFWFNNKCNIYYITNNEQTKPFITAAGPLTYPNLRVCSMASNGASEREPTVKNAGLIKGNSVWTRAGGVKLICNYHSTWHYIYRTPIKHRFVCRFLCMNVQLQGEGENSHF